MYRDNRGGTILYMGLGAFAPCARPEGAYVTAKHGLMGLARTVAKEGRCARRARQRDLSRLRAHAARREADPEQARRSASARKT
jgi:hypothetical protein